MEMEGTDHACAQHCSNRDGDTACHSTHDGVPVTEGVEPAGKHYDGEDRKECELKAKGVNSCRGKDQNDQCCNSKSVKRGP